jgi:hypothetical protein
MTVTIDLTTSQALADPVAVTLDPHGCEPVTVVAQAARLTELTAGWRTTCPA